MCVCACVCVCVRLQVWSGAQQLLAAMSPSVCHSQIFLCSQASRDHRFVIFLLDPTDPSIPTPTFGWEVRVTRGGQTKRAVRGQHEREGLGWILLGARPLLLAAGRQRLAQLGSPLEQWRCR
ncbi:hypothetical protein B0J15DRAFT_259805 [Fusarium solani]|uniref:Secreted protein n=1 Tax=Fusarium solani TaxID=169388 RepID=A0A9P9HU09_FUSSL|nr:uncharacterized protein B0J15DRAFT_259805 [Fusarium solani]KAH7264003.1 hypothetical protein B0J15DRAFT_259805 [Fusarium solani]